MNPGDELLEAERLMSFAKVLTQDGINTKEVFYFDPSENSYMKAVLTIERI